MIHIFKDMSEVLDFSPHAQVVSFPAENQNNCILISAIMPRWPYCCDRLVEIDSELLDAEMFCCKGNIVSLGDDSSETVFLDIILGAMSEEISRMTCLQLASVPSIVHP